MLSSSCQCWQTGKETQSCIHRALHTFVLQKDAVVCSATIALHTGTINSSQKLLVTWRSGITTFSCLLYCALIAVCMRSARRWGRCAAASCSLGWWVHALFTCSRLELNVAQCNVEKLSHFKRRPTRIASRAQEIPRQICSIGIAAEQSPVSTQGLRSFGYQLPELLACASCWRWRCASLLQMLRSRWESDVAEQMECALSFSDWLTTAFLHRQSRFMHDAFSCCDQTAD